MPRSLPDRAGRLLDVIRRVVLAAVATATLTACSTFSNENTVARFDDEEFTQDDLDDALGGEGTRSADAARAAINEWLFPLIIESELLGEDALANVDDAVVAARYAQGIEVAGVACPDVMVTESGEAADDAAARLRDGDEYATVFEEFNLDPNLTADGGGCIPLAQIDPAATSSPDVRALFSITESDPVAAATTQTQLGDEFGLVVVHRPYAELNEVDGEAARTQIASSIVADGIDVYVDPRYGTFDPSFGVVPLGG